jgi:phage-related protein
MRLPASERKAATNLSLKIPLDNMSNLTYLALVSPKDKPLVWETATVTTPPMSKAARIQAGYLLRQLQAGVGLSMPDSRPMSNVGRRCHELRVVDNDADQTWRIVYRIDSDAIVVLHWFSKKTATTPQSVIDTCKLRIKRYDAATRD